MDKEVKTILGEFLSSKQIEILQKRLWDKHCIIYHSKLPRLTGRPVQHIDATPDNDYPLRILRAYRQDCNCQWAEDTDGVEVRNPLLKAMNEQNEKRAKILDRAIARLQSKPKEKK